MPNISNFTNALRLRVRPFLSGVGFLGKILIYVAALIGFSVVYWMKAEDFYHANLEREPEYLELVADFEKELARLININKDAYWRARSIPEIYLAESVEDAATVVEITGVKKGYIDIVLSAGAIRDHTGETVVSWSSVSAQVKRSPKTSISNTGNGTNLFQLSFSDSELELRTIEALTGADLGPSEYLDYESKDMIQSVNDPDLRPLRLDIRQESEALGVREKLLKKMAKGDASETTDVFWRMLYFSAITGTTIGYGDITPLTKGMRLTVALQTIICLILLGWCIEGIARGRAPK